MENGENIKHSNLIRECMQLLSKNWSVSLKHIYREGNQVADFLVNLSLDLSTQEDTQEVTVRIFFKYDSGDKKGFNK